MWWEIILQAPISSVKSRKPAVKSGQVHTGTSLKMHLIRKLLLRNNVPIMHPVKIYLSPIILLCVISSLPVQSPITNIVSWSFDSSPSSSHQGLSFPPQTDMNSPDGPRFQQHRCPAANKQHKANKKADELFIHITTQTLDGSGHKSCWTAFGENWPCDILIWIKAILWFLDCLFCLKVLSAAWLRHSLLLTGT